MRELWHESQSCCKYTQNMLDLEFVCVDFDLHKPTHKKYSLNVFQAQRCSMLFKIDFHLFLILLSFM